jgi:transposase-like protein
MQCRVFSEELKITADHLAIERGVRCSLAAPRVGIVTNVVSRGNHEARADNGHAIPGRGQMILVDESGKGFNVELNAMPVGGKRVIRNHEPNMRARHHQSTGVRSPVVASRNEGSKGSSDTEGDLFLNSKTGQ